VIPKARATAEDGKIVLRSAYGQRHLCKAIPGAWWDGKAWTYPLSPLALQGIVEHFGWEALDDDLLERLRWWGSENGVPSPDGKLSPWPHQAMAFREAFKLSGYMLAFDMGTGKTKVAIDLACAWGSESVLVICPKSVIHVWPAEFRKHSVVPYVLVPLTQGSVADKARQAARMMAGGRPTVLVINYESAFRPAFKEFALGRRWDLVICDEVHHIKAAGGKISMFCARLRDRAERRLGLTGTPMPHSPIDLYAQFRFLDISVFGTSFVRFRARYAVMGGFEGRQVMAFKNQEEMNRRFYAASFRVTKRDVLDLPPVEHQTRYCDLDGKERKAYREVETEFYTWLEEAREEVTVSNALVKLLRLQQATGGYLKTDEGNLVRLGRSKLGALAEFLDDLPIDEPLVIFCRFAERGADLGEIKAMVEKSGRKALELSGRCNEFREWQEGAAPVLVSQIQAGAEGIDMTRAAYCFFFSVGFSLGRFLQAQARLDRPGQTRPVTYVHLVARDTVDERVYKALSAREKVVEYVLELGKQITQRKGRGNE